MSLNIVYPVAEAVASRDASEGWNGTLLRRRFEAKLAEACDGDDWLAAHPPEVSWIKDLIPFQQPQAAALPRDLAQAYEDVAGQTLPTEHMVGWTESAYCQVLAGMDTVNFAPGEPGQAHATREHVDIQTVLDYTKALALYLYRALAVE
jgi:acetylornithine deacetylase